MVRLTSWIVAGLAIASVASGDEPIPPGHVLSARVGRTERGVPRVVIEMDRPVQFLTVEHAQGNGFDVILLGTDTTSVPAASVAGDEVVRSLDFHASASGLVARVTLGEERRSGRAYALENPTRVVLDLPLPGEPADTAASSRNSAATTPARKTPSAPKHAASTSPARVPASTPPVAAAPRDTSPAHATATAPESTIATELSHAERAAADADTSARPGAEKDLGEVIAWVHDLKNVIESIRKSGDGASRARARRGLAQLLQQRGLYIEAEKALLGAAATAPGDTSAAIRDSLDVAELRVARGDVAGALAVASVLDASRVSSEDRVRLARVLLDSDKPDLAESVLAPALAALDGAPKARAALLMARSHWDRADPKKALPYAVELVASTSTPEDVFSRAIMLQADCLCALDRAKEARQLYEQASKLSLTAEDASWAWLQLGNLARREGRLDEAKQCYETTKERWPESFYASQADWFLRFDERLRALRDADAGKTRG